MNIFIRMRTISYFISSFIPSTFHTKKSEFHTIINIFIRMKKISYLHMQFHTFNITCFIRSLFFSYLRRRRRRRRSYSMILQRDPGRLRLSQGVSLEPDESEGCSPVSGGRTIRLRSLWPSDDHRLQASYPTSTSDRHWCRGSRRSLRQVFSGGGDCRLSKGC